MNQNGAAYTRDRSAPGQIRAHLADCDASFVPALSSRVDLRDYSRKLSERSTRFEAWAGDLLVGLLAAYFNDGPPRCAFISNVSVLPEWRSRGVAPTLLEHCIAHARAERAAFIALEVGAANRPARRLYERYGFQPEADAEAEAPAALDASDATLRLRLALNPEGIP